MSYTIYNTDGTILLTLGEGKVDQKNTSISLIGKNVSSYGEYFNNNLIGLLANFASVDEPRSPLVGQLWYETAAGRVKVYDRNSIIRPITNTLVGDAQPVELAPADFWFDTLNDQLYFKVDSNNVNLIGPIDSTQYGKTGWITETRLDTVGAYRNIMSLYSNNNLVGMYSTGSFTLAASTSGMATLEVGFNLNQSIQNNKFIGTATSAESVSGLDVTTVLRNNINQSTTGSFSVINDLGLLVIDSVNNQLTIYNNPFSNIATIAYNSTDRDLRMQITNASLGLTSTIYVDAYGLNLGIWNEDPQYPLDVLGNTRIRGNLFVEGTVTNITSVALQINDKNIELGYNNSLDATADGGGITLHGTTDHTILWQNNQTGWNFSTNTNITTASSYKIGGVNVVSSSTLGLGITAAPGLSRVGTLSYLTVTNIYISSNTISSSGTNADLRLDAVGTGNINATGNKIINVSTATTDLDAANKKYVDDKVFLVGTKNFAISLDTTNFNTVYSGQLPNPLQYGVGLVLSAMFPITNVDTSFNIPDGVRAKVLCGTNTIPPSTASVTVSYSTIQVDKDGFYSTATVVSGITGAIAGSLPVAPTVSVSYAVQTWTVSSSTWQYQTSVAL